MKKIILRVVIPDRKLEKILEINNSDLLWDAKLRILQSGDLCLREPLNYGFFMNPRNGRSGKFLDEWRPASHYSFETPLDHIEFVKKRRLYKNTGLSEIKVKRLRSKSNTNEFIRLVKEQNIEEVTKYLNRGFDPNCQDLDSKETPLTMSVKYSNCDLLISELYRAGAHLDYRNGGSYTALHEAVKCRNINAVKSLMDLGMSAKVRDGNNLTALYHGVSLNCSIEIIRLLLYDHSPVGCVSDENGMSELHLACIGCSPQVVDLLIFYGSDFNLKNRSGENCLHICSRLNKAQTAQCLLIRGINQMVLNGSGKTALEIAMLCRNTETANVIRGFDRSNINPHNEVPVRNEHRRSTTCEPRISLSHNDLSHHSRNLSVTSAFSSLISRIKNKKSKVVGSLLPNNHILSDFCSSTNIKQENQRPFVIRTLYIVKNRKPFGFVLRGPKKRKTHDDLTAKGDSLPSYHFIETVEKNSVAERSGLSVNDFILEIDNKDVRCLSHIELVSIIRRCGSEITFKVGTFVSDRNENITPIISEKLESDLLLKRKLTINSLRVNPHSSGASLRAIPRNDIEKINKLFGDESDNEIEKPPPIYCTKKSSISVEDIILPPPDEFCDSTILIDPPIQFSSTKVSMDSNLKEQLNNVRTKKMTPPMPPLRTTSIKSTSSACGMEHPSENSSNHLDELRAVLKRRLQDGSSIVNKIEQKNENCWNFENRAIKPTSNGNYSEKPQVEPNSLMLNDTRLSSGLSNRMQSKSKPNLYHYDSGVEMAQRNDDVCNWLLDLHQSKTTKFSSRTDKNFAGKHTIF